MNNGETLSIRQLTSCVGMIKKPVYRWLVLGRTDRASLQRKMVPALVWGRKSGGTASEPSPNGSRRFFFLLPFSFGRPKEKVKAP